MLSTYPSTNLTAAVVVVVVVVVVAAMPTSLPLTISEEIKAMKFPYMESYGTILVAPTTTTTIHSLIIIVIIVVRKTHGSIIS